MFSFLFYRSIRLYTKLEMDEIYRRLKANVRNRNISLEDGRFHGTVNMNGFQIRRNILWNDHSSEFDEIDTSCSSYKEWTKDEAKFFSFYAIAALTPMVKGEILSSSKGSVIEARMTLPSVSYGILFLFLLPILFFLGALLTNPGDILFLFHQYKPLPYILLGLPGLFIACLTPFWSSHFEREAEKAKQFLWITLDAKIIPE